MGIIKSQKGYLTILTGKTNMGKSTITVFDCSEQLRKGEQVIFFSYEYIQSIIYQKLISHFHLSWSDLFKFNLVDSSSLSLDTLKVILENKKDSVDVVYVDYLDLLKQATYPNGTDATKLEEIQTIVKELADLAKKYNIAIILLSQTGASTDFEKTVEQLNSFTQKAPNTIKMFLGKSSVIDERIATDNIPHLILVDGYNLSHFSSINLKEIYND